MSHINAVRIQSTLTSSAIGCGVAALVLLATYAYGGLYQLGALVAVVAGLSGAALQLAYWRSRQEWLSLLPIAAIGLGAIAANGNLLWGFPQTFAFAYLLMHVPLLLLWQPIRKWLSKHDS